MKKRPVRIGFFISGVMILIAGLLFLLDIFKGERIALLALIYCTMAWLIGGIIIAVINIVSLKKTGKEKIKF